ncbi:MAG: hypothetical protein LBB54_02475, partial [Cellulomonadaceae bacterium]|nr:hypothetical protein [Cellulomonadaceae bacterium]
DEWEIVSYQPSPANPLAFTGLVRRPTQRDWTPPPPPTCGTRTPAGYPSADEVSTRTIVSARGRALPAGGQRSACMVEVGQGLVVG